MRRQLKNGEKGVYRCSRYNNNGGKACTPHYVDERDLTAFVLNDIRLYANIATTEREQLAKRLLSSMKRVNISESSTLKTKIREAENRLAVISSTFKGLYEDKYAGKIPESVFLNLVNSFTKEQTELEERLPNLHIELSSIQETTNGIEDWLSTIGQYLELETLERNIVTGLIESITVSEKSKIDSKKTQEIQIEYRFIKTLLADTKEGTA